MLRTTAGDLTLEELALDVGGRTWRILHSGAVLSHDDEERYLTSERSAPYGLVLWPAAIALAHEVASRALGGKRVLELGAGTGLPGLVAAGRGAQVVQTDRQPIALHVARMNAEKNGGLAIEHREADWTAWNDDATYDVILGSDVLYAERTQPFLRRIFEKNLAPGGNVLLSDPFRAGSFAFLETLEAAGWTVTFDKWTVGAVPPERPVGVFALRPPA